MFNPLKIKTVLVAIAVMPSFTFAQNYEVKKGKVSIDNNIIATYDGKGGLLRLFDLTVSTPAQKPLISLKEKMFDFKNPLRRGDIRWVEITFLDKPEKKMNFHFPYNNRPLERDLIGLLFKDSTPSIIQGEALNAAVVDEFIKSHNYDFIADSLYIREFEKANLSRIMEPLERDKKQPLTLKVESTGSEIVVGNMVHTTVYNIFQDNVLIGQIVKELTGAKAYYLLWKRTLTPYTFEGKQMKFGMLAYMETDNDTFDQEVILMTDKKRLKFKAKDHTAAQYQLADLLLSSGLL